MSNTEKPTPFASIAYNIFTLTLYFAITSCIKNTQQLKTQTPNDALGFVNDEAKPTGTNINNYRIFMYTDEELSMFIQENIVESLTVQDLRMLCAAKTEKTFTEHEKCRIKAISHIKIFIMAYITIFNTLDKNLNDTNSNDFKALQVFFSDLTLESIRNFLNAHAFNLQEVVFIQNEIYNLVKHTPDKTYGKLLRIFKAIDIMLISLFPSDKYRNRLATQDEKIAWLKKTYNYGERITNRDANKPLAQDPAYEQEKQQELVKKAATIKSNVSLDKLDIWFEQKARQYQSGMCSNEQDAKRAQTHEGARQDGYICDGRSLRRVAILQQYFNTTLSRAQDFNDAFKTNIDTCPERSTTLTNTSI